MPDIPENGVVVDPPQFLPEGWQCVRITYTTGSSAGTVYHRYYSGKHKRISSIRQCIELAAKDRGVDAGPELKAYDEGKKNEKKERGEAPEEQFDDFLPEQSGLDAEILAALPPDAPPGSEAFDRVKVGKDLAGNLRAGFRSGPAELGRINFQVTQAAALNNLYAAFRIVRACYAMLQEGLTKECSQNSKKNHWPT